MFGVLASCLLLLALGLPGTMALRRLTDRLTTLELWAYGLPLGVVLGSLALLLLAVIAGGLWLPLILTVAVGSLVVATALGPWRTVAAAFGGAIGREQRLGFAAAATTKGKGKDAAAATQWLVDGAMMTFGLSRSASSPHSSSAGSSSGVAC